VSAPIPAASKWRIPRRPIERLVPLAVCGTLVAAFSLHALDELSAERIGIDDASIYFRYAANVAAGHGFVWNPGGERVEGATSFLWTLLASAAFRLCGHPERALFWLNTIGVGAAAALWVQAHRPLAGRSGRTPAWLALLGAGLGCGWLLASPSYLVWGVVTLMETGAWSALLLTTFALAVACAAAPRSSPRRGLWSAALFLLAWARPEGAALSLALPAVAALLLRGRGEERIAAALWAPAAAALAGNVSLFGFRRLYFGFWLPNTYYAKVGGDLPYNLEQGWSYARAFVAAYPLVLLAIALAAAACLLALSRGVAGSASRSRPANHGLALAVLSGSLLLGGFASAIWVGGDHFDGWRFLQPYWPFALSVLVASPSAFLGPQRLARRGSLAAAGTLALAAAVAAASYLGGPVSWRDLRRTSGLHHEFQVAEYGRRYGRVLHHMFRNHAKPTLGVLVAGGLPFAYEGPCFDLLGLNDVAMAHATRDRRRAIKGHAAFDPKTFYARPPEILFTSVWPCRLDRPQRNLAQDWVRSAIKDVHLEPRFRDLYVPVVFSPPFLAAGGIGFCEYVRRDYVPTLRGLAIVREIPR